MALRATPTATLRGASWTRTLRQAKPQLYQLRTAPTACFSSSSINAQTSSAPSPLAFAFDIDGVLKAGPTVLPQALKALRILHGGNRYRAKIPYVLVTNGGGVSEQERAERLTKELQHEIGPEQVLQAHTVLQSLTKLYGNDPVLVIGGPSSRASNGSAVPVMKAYGFKNVYTPYDLQLSAPASWPFARPSAQEMQEADSKSRTDFSQVHFKAVIVFHDSRDWGRDIQIMTDILRSKDGVFGTLAEERELKSRKQIPLYFSHGDLLWGNDFPVSRFGQGAFRAAFENVWTQTTGLPLECTVFGKPEGLTYEYAAEMLRSQFSNPDESKRAQVYMIGDNPESDIRGGRDFGWKTALVRTGVYRDAQGKPKYEPTMLVDDVEAAVKQAIEIEWGPGAADDGGN